MLRFFLGLLLFIPFINTYSQENKTSEFAGLFYPADKTELNNLVDNFLSQVGKEIFAKKIIGMIVPHAGYIYSGQIAAYAYKAALNKNYDAIIILGPAHQYFFKGISVYPQGAFIIPLGSLAVNSPIADELLSLPFAIPEKKYFANEHSLEVQLPFILKSFSPTTIVPVVIGQITYAQLDSLAQKLNELSQKNNILVIASTDLSHFHPYQDAGQIDRETIGMIENLDIDTLWTKQNDHQGRACGISGLTALLLYAQKQSAKIKILQYANSGDVTREKQKVVGYLSAVIYQNADALINPIAKNKEDAMAEYTLLKSEKITLLKLAREALVNYFNNKKTFELNPIPDNLTARRGAFVTLTKNGQLRGCIGRIVGDKPVYKVIGEYAVHAAIDDPRFSPVTAKELNELDIEISILTPFEKVKDIDEIEVGKHGLMIEKGFSSGLLLPQVPVEWGWDKKTFLEHTCQKAGLDKNTYQDKTAILYKFSAIVFNEKDLCPPARK
jgi:hypothetical protein